MHRYVISSYKPFIQEVSIGAELNKISIENKRDKTKRALEKTRNKTIWLWNSQVVIRIGVIMDRTSIIRNRIRRGRVYKRLWRSLPRSTRKEAGRRKWLKFNEKNDIKE